jgi:hypothetical protein
MAGGEFGLQSREIGSAFVDDDHFVINDPLAENIEGAGDQGKSFGPVQPVAGVDLSSFRGSGAPGPGSRRT